MPDLLEKKNKIAVLKTFKTLKEDMEMVNKVICEQGDRKPKGGPILELKSTIAGMKNLLEYLSKYKDRAI